MCYINKAHTRSSARRRRPCTPAGRKTVRGLDCDRKTQLTHGRWRTQVESHHNWTSPITTGQVPSQLDKSHHNWRTLRSEDTRSLAAVGWRDRHNGHDTANKQDDHVDNHNRKDECQRATVARAVRLVVVWACCCVGVLRGSCCAARLVRRVVCGRVVVWACCCVFSHHRVGPKR